MLRWGLVLLFLGIGCLARAQLSSFPPGTFQSRGPLDANSSCTPVYVTGDRTASITVTVSAGISVFGGTLDNYVDGAFANNTSDSVVVGVVDDTNEWLKFNFGSSKLITEAKYYQQDNSTQGNWKWQGSNDDSSYTDIGVSFALGTTTVQTQTQLNGNATQYQYYRLFGTGSGGFNGGIFQQEIEFKQCP